MKLDYHKMLKEICKLTENDFCSEMELRQLEGKYTQKEAERMSELLGKIYSISHCIHCKACQLKYKLND